MLLICTIWGFNFVAAKVGVREIPPLLFTGLRFSILAIALLPFLKPARGRMRDVLVIALFNGAIHFGLMFIGIATAAASVVAVVAQLNVPFATMLSIFFLGEVVQMRRWAGIALTFLGVTIVSFDPHVFDALTGVLFAAGAALSAAIAAVCMRNLTKVGVFQLQSWTALITAPILLSASFLFESGQGHALTHAQPLTWAALLFTTIGASLIGHNAYYYLLQRYEVSLIAPLSLLSPLLGVVFGISMLGEHLSLRIVVGALTAFAGVGVLAIPGRKKLIAAAAETSA
jgi:O-acetylserine/cysteine efflux transporter